MNLKKSILKIVTVISLVLVVSLSFTTPVGARTQTFGPICSSYFDDNCDDQPSFEDPIWDFLPDNFSINTILVDNPTHLAIIYRIQNNYPKDVQCELNEQEITLESVYNGYGTFMKVIESAEIREAGGLFLELECLSPITNQLVEREMEMEIPTVVDYQVEYIYSSTNRRAEVALISTTNSICTTRNPNYERLILKAGEVFRSSYTVDKGFPDYKCTAMVFRPLYTTGSLSLR